MQLRRHSVIEWSIIAVCLASAAGMVVWRTNTYERQGTLQAMQAEVQSAEASRRLYQTALTTVEGGARRAKVDANPAVRSAIFALQRERDEALLRSLASQVDYKIDAFWASDVVILTNFSSFVEATNAQLRLSREGVEAQVRGGHLKDSPWKSFHLFVHQSNAPRACELLPGLLAQDHMLSPTR